MKNIIKLLFVGLCLTLLSCVKAGKLEDDGQVSNSVTEAFQAFSRATQGTNPDSLKKNEQAFFYSIAKTYLNEYSVVAVESYKILNLDYNGSFTTSDGTTYRATNVFLQQTDYSLPTNEHPTPSPVKSVEIDLQLVPSPYLIWVKNGGNMPPYQDYWLYSGFEDNGEKLFYNLKTYDRVEKLPQKLIDENRCYGFAQCEITLHYVEFDVYQKNPDTGKIQRYHITNSFTGQLPYLASNPKQCLDTNVTVKNSQGQDIEVPYQVCRILTDFVPGSNTSL